MRKRATRSLALSREPAEAPEYKRITLAREGFVAVLPRSHPLAKQKVIALPALKEIPFVLFPRMLSPILHDEIMSACRAGGFEPDVSQELPEWHTIVGFVAAGAAVSIAPESVQAMGRRDVVYRRLRGSRAKTRLMLAWPGSGAPPAVESLIAVARDVFS